MCLRSHEKKKEVKARKVSCSKVGHPSGQLPGTGIPSGIERVCLVFLTVLQEGETLLCRRDHVGGLQSQE